MQTALGITAGVVLLAELLLCLVIMISAIVWAYFELGKGIIKKIKGGKSDDQK